MMKLKDAAYWIRSLNLIPHPEGEFLDIQVNGSHNPKTFTRKNS